MMDEVLAALELADKMADKALELKIKLEEAKQLLKEAVEFMNLVPNNMITYSGEIVDADMDYGIVKTINHYELCSKIDEFLKEK